MATEPHPHAAALDRIGRDRVSDHFKLSRQGLHNWRMRGVPDGSRRAVAVLATLHGVSVPELGEGGL